MWMTLWKKKDRREISDMKEFVIEKTERMEFVLKQIAKILATNTNYATVVSAPQDASRKSQIYSAFRGR